LLYQAAETSLPYRIQRSVTDESIVFSLSGELDSEHVGELERLLEREPQGHILLNLKDVTLVDRAAVRFLARLAPQRIQCVNCPEYVRRWVAAEREEDVP
jgi:anti-anti-sigma regulatory factor